MNDQLAVILSRANIISKAIISKQFKLDNFEVLPENNPTMQQKFFLFATGETRPLSWFEGLSISRRGQEKGQEPAQGLEEE